MALAGACSRSELTQSSLEIEFLYKIIQDIFGKVCSNIFYLLALGLLGVGGARLVDADGRVPRPPPLLLLLVPPPAAGLGEASALLLTNPLPLWPFSCDQPDTRRIHLGAKLVHSNLIMLAGSYHHGLSPILWMVPLACFISFCAASGRSSVGRSPKSAQVEDPQLSSKPTAQASAEPTSKQHPVSKAWHDCSIVTAAPMFSTIATHAGAVTLVLAEKTGSKSSVS